MAAEVIPWFNNEKCTGDAVTQIVKGSTGNKKFWAKWEANKYKVHFDGNGADGETMNDQTFTYDKEQALMANTFTKTGCTLQAGQKHPTHPQKSLEMSSP